ncbi:hypothetical protein HanXRQr2_Chr16g0766751 [Helianthus annuus]|uniref:Uncharacterized protein n=1 Tax=Helianthus annuus TaxID=4232 RepID=A0A9K3DUE0_HELAN|nr:hypothetical protein HanXRQr2_Chr16g0766751 [Helianthus annuus]
MVASPVATWLFVATWLSVATWFVILLWKQLNHLGIAGFGPETFRLDPYVNVSCRKLRLMVQKQAYSNPIAHPVTSRKAKSVGTKCD